MVPVKVNIFISSAPEDKPQLDKLRRWLYPMLDEVNVWPKDAPKKPSELSLPWQILLFWYSPPDNREQFKKVVQVQREKAHIYLFLTSYKSLSNKQVEEDIDVAAHRRIEGDDVVGPFVFPVILSPSRWKEESRLAGFKPLAGGVPLSSFKLEETGYLAVTEEVSALIKVLQKRLGEEKFYQSRLAKPDNDTPAVRKRSLPYTGGADESLELQEIAPFQPAEWLGWSILLFLFISLIGSLMPTRVLGPKRYQNVKSADDHGWEYLREHPMMPPKDSIPFPIAD
jgi:hypothetical protein